MHPTAAVGGNKKDGNKKKSQREVESAAQRFGVHGPIVSPQESRPKATLPLARGGSVRENEEMADKPTETSGAEWQPDPAKEPGPVFIGYYGNLIETLDAM